MPDRPMRVLFDLKHPAQVLLFKDAIRILLDGGHRVLVTSRGKDETLDLLDELGIRHLRLSEMSSGLAGMGLELAWRTGRLLELACRFHPDVMLAKTGISVAMVGRLLNVPSIIYDDTEFASLQIALSAPFATVVCTGMGYERRFPGKEVRYNAPPHLAYTHPSRFTPDPNLLRRHGVQPDEPYTVLRLKAWHAIHDLGVAGYGPDDMLRLVRRVAEHARPVISAEGDVPDEVAAYLNPVPVRDVLHLLAFARLYVGEGSSMAAEAACLGTPAVYLSPESRRGYLDEMERRYGHVTTVHTVADAIERSCAWLADPAVEQRAAEARARLLAECDDPVEFMLDLIRQHAGR